MPTILRYMGWNLLLYTPGATWVCWELRGWWFSVGCCGFVVASCFPDGDLCKQIVYFTSAEDMSCIQNTVSAITGQLIRCLESSCLALALALALADHVFCLHELGCIAWLILHHSVRWPQDWTFHCASLPGVNLRPSGLNKAIVDIGFQPCRPIDVLAFVLCFTCISNKECLGLEKY